MIRLFFLLALVASVVLAAPVPKPVGTPAEKLARLYGEPAGVEGATAKLDRNALVMTVTKLTASQMGGCADTPRLVRKVKGDFTATVTVLYKLPESAEQKDANDAGSLAASLGAWSPKASYTSYVSHVLRDDKPYAAIVGQEHEFPGQISRSIWKYPDGKRPAVDVPIRLTITRRGHEITTGFAFGKHKEVEESFPAKLPDEMMVGVGARSNRDVPFEVTFWDFKITPLKAEKR